ncbi:MAG: ABC transporter substrate-binding protein [Phycisphaerales bacterium]|nr:MAG: ABC transporter substrate-binding protein [Phycisphaerales bacterium]
MNRMFSWLLLVLLGVVGCAADDQHGWRAETPATPPETDPMNPFFDARAYTAEYAGPGRQVPSPTDIKEVKIGWFGPSDPNDAEAGAMWCAAMMAIEEANCAGGYNRLPFRLVASWSENPWGSGIKYVTRLVYDEDVWAIVGAPDGPSAHLVEQVVAKARLPFISPVATDKTANLANVPWIFSCTPGDHLQASVLAQALVSHAEERGFAVVSCIDHDSRAFTTELLAALSKLERFPSLHVQFRPRSPGFDSQLRSISQVQPAALALIAGAQDAGRFMRTLRQEGLTVPIFGGPAMGRRLFIETAGQYAEGVVFPLLWQPSVTGMLSAEFARRFQQQYGMYPDYTAAHTYDAMNLLIAAIRTAGLNRVLIRDATRELSPFPGITGHITWDPTGHNHRPVGLGTIQDGRVVPE